MKVKKGEDIRKKIIEKALKDPAFKQALLSNPKQALADNFKITVPAEIEIRVVEETKSLFYLVIPPYCDPRHDIVGWD